MRLVGKLLGEELKLSSTRIRKDPTVLCVKTTLATAKFLNAIALPRYLMLNSIRLVPIPPNQCPPVVLAESFDKLQIALDVITKWSDIHDMSINAGKCGVMPVNCAPSGTFQIQNQAVTIVPKFTLNVLQAVLMPIGTYGGELFGMSEVRTKPIQMAADKALRLIARVSKATAMNRLRNEFGIQSINSVCSRLRERAHL
ncbi:hypothetical protein BB561_005352 [Smittium simulii]|uniref:Uncharacterized protein n=1 Tax=Smittium simulii TaxID=133385 RepID=A0A2T9YAV4_9FUNG|nr:hypothetical protein BB561_005352 [Smittium simulii]